MLEVENDQGCGVAELLEDRGDHHGAEPHRIASDYEEGELPCEACANEAVVESGMRDGRGILAADCVEHEVERREDEDAPDESDPEDDFGKFHFCLKTEARRSNASESQNPHFSQKTREIGHPLHI